MTKGKKWTLRLLGVAALALLICLCLLGSTMARYTSSGVGSGSLTVAVWDLETTTVEIKDDDVESISPSMDEYSDSVARTNQSSWIKAFDMTNNSDVDAAVEIALKTDEEGNANIGVSWDDDFIWGTGWDESNTDYKLEDGTYVSKGQTNEYAQGIMKMFGYNASGASQSEIDAANLASFVSLVNAWGIFSLKLAYECDESTQDATKATIGDQETYVVEADAGETLSFTLDAKDTVDGTTSRTIYAEVVWTSICQQNADDSNKKMPDGFTTDNAYADYGSSAWEVFSDAVDTILGMYSTGLSFDVTWTAYQASTLPPTTVNP